MFETIFDLEMGGVDVAKDELVWVLDQWGGASVEALSHLIGLPQPIVLQLLNELNKNNIVRARQGGRLWNLNF